MTNDIKHKLVNTLVESAKNYVNENGLKNISFKADSIKPMRYSAASFILSNATQSADDLIFEQYTLKIKAMVRVITQSVLDMNLSTDTNATIVYNPDSCFNLYNNSVDNSDSTEYQIDFLFDIIFTKVN